MKKLIEKNLKKSKFVLIIDKQYAVIDNVAMITDCENTMLLKKAEMPNGVYNVLHEKTMDELNEFPLVDNVETNAKEINAAEFIAVFKELSKYMGKDETRPVLIGMYYNAELKEVCSTDAHALRTTKIDLGKESFNIPRTFDIKGLESCVKHFKKETVTLTVNEKNIQFDGGDFILNCRLIEGRFPSYQSVIPAQSTKKIIFDLDKAKEIYNNVKKLHGKKTADMQMLQFKDNKAFIQNAELDLYFEFNCKQTEEAKETNVSECMLIMPAMATDFDSDIAFIFENMLKANSGEFNFTEPRRAAIFKVNKPTAKPTAKKTAKKTAKPPKDNNLQKENESLKKEIEELKQTLKRLKDIENNRQAKKTALNISAPAKEIKAEIKEQPQLKVEIVDYSEKAIVVIGDTKPIKEQLKKMYGRFNPKLKCGAGWIFSKKRMPELQTLIASL